jgi:hypothetical protein
MKVEVEWIYAFMTAHRFKAVVDVDRTGKTRQEAIDEAVQAAFMVPNGDFKPIDTTYPGDPVDELVKATVVHISTRAGISPIAKTRTPNSWRRHDEEEARPDRSADHRPRGARRPRSGADA